jgi:hypothetical protein
MARVSARRSWTTRAFRCAWSTLRVIWTQSRTPIQAGGCLRVASRPDRAASDQATTIPTFSLAWRGTSTDGRAGHLDKTAVGSALRLRIYFAIKFVRVVIGMKNLADRAFSRELTLAFEIPRPRRIRQGGGHTPRHANRGVAIGYYQCLGRKWDRFRGRLSDVCNDSGGPGRRPPTTRAGPERHGGPGVPFEPSEITEPVAPIDHPIAAGTTARSRSASPGGATPSCSAMSRSRATQSSTV